MSLTSFIGTLFPLTGGKLGIIEALIHVDSVFRQRKQLATLDARLRRDIGVSEADVAQELRTIGWRKARQTVR